MSKARHTHILFDFFGTLVDYSASRTDQGYPRSHALLRRFGARLTYAEFLAAWSRISAEFDRRSDQDDHEFSMTEVGIEFLAGALGRRATGAEVEAFVEAYVSEWSKGVKYSTDVYHCVRALAGDFRLAVVTNTHRADLVPGHLTAMGLRSCFDAVITSVEVGWRKPHPRIYAAALDALGIGPRDALFVGDTYAPDFLGPERAGITALLIDPDRRSPVPAARRLDSILDLPKFVVPRS
jgi:putative hydrolase of the HAD superfamily